ncbi:MAG: hypothetical protein MI924_01340 [Chloroflexales bacterium]|nr:hypothetical protein [Chloroflexales bacterium]
MTGNFTEMIGPLTPLLVCWASLIITVVGLVVSFYFTNITAFARRLRSGRKPTVGAEPRDTAAGRWR